MLAAFGVDVLDPRTTPRRVSVLLDRLPPQARLPGEVWTVEAELLAVLIDHMANLTWVVLQAAGAKNATRPKPLPRPPRRHTPPPPQPVPQRTWADAAMQLTAIPGVVTRTDSADG
jgi:hypothetical protein